MTKAKSSDNAESLFPKMADWSDREIEREKQKAMRFYSSLTDFSARLGARAIVISAHHERSYRLAQKQGRSHPSLEEYLPHWLASGKEYEDEDIYRFLSERYPPPKVLKIRKGDSYWRG